VTRRYRTEEDLDLLAEAVELAAGDTRTLILDGWLDAVKPGPATMNHALRLQAMTDLAQRCGAVFHPGRPHAEVLTAAARLSRLAARGIGHPLPRCVILGEGPSRNTWRGLPFSGGSAAKLLRETLGARTDLYYLNARGGVGEAFPTAELSLVTARAQVLILLGSAAAKAAKRHGFTGVLHPHPAHYLRFRRGDLAQWQADLLDLLK
jgi:uracil-DNA glycosylase